MEDCETGRILAERPPTTADGDQRCGWANRDQTRPNFFFCRSASRIEIYQLV